MLTALAKLLRFLKASDLSKIEGDYGRAQRASHTVEIMPASDQIAHR
jgi:hypothetical protein